MTIEVGHNLKTLFEAELANTPDDVEAAEGRFVAMIDDLVKSGKLRPEDISFRECLEQISYTMFPTITGSLISQKIIEGYKSIATIGNQLVTTVQSNKRSENVVGFTAVGSMEEVQEGEPYPEHGFGEKYVVVTNKKYGDMLSITDETIKFEQTGQVLNRARQIGRKAALYKEKIILDTVQDAAGNYAYYPSGTRTILYSTGHANLVASNTLADWTDIDNAQQLLMVMTDEVSDYILAQPKVILVPTALMRTASYILNNTQDTRATIHADAPKLPTLQLLTSPFLDAKSTSYWYLGDPKEQFIWQEVWPLQLFSQDMKRSDDAFNRDVYAKFKVRFYGGCGTLDYRYFIKNTT